MRTDTITLNNKEYILSFSLYTIQELINKYGDTDIQKIFNTDDINKGLDETLWILHNLMLSGKKYSEINGLKVEEIPDTEILKYIIGIDDIKTIQEKIYSCINNGSNRNLELDVKKTVNQETE